MLGYVRRHKGEMREHELLFQLYYRISVATLRLRCKEEPWRIVSLSHDSVSNMLRGSDSPTPVAVVICFIFYFCGLVCEELKHIRLCLCLVCSGVSRKALGGRLRKRGGVDRREGSLRWMACHMHRGVSCMLLVQSLRRALGVAFDPGCGSVTCLR